MEALIWACAAGAGALTVHSVVNAFLLRRPATAPAAVDVPVAVLLPVRDEAHRVTPCLTSLLAQTGVPDLRILVLDDGSTDGTADVVRAVARGAGGDRVELIGGAALPAGWLGKPHACHQLAARAAADGAELLVFVDADVVLAPGALAAVASVMGGTGVDLLSMYPKIEVGTVGERLVQPLLQWSWLTFLPLRAMERSRRPSLAAAGGQFLAVRTAGYTAAGGHAAVRHSVLEDIDLARAVKRAGGRIALADGSAVAGCRMYTSWREVVDGYSKSLWASFGSPAGAALVVGLLFTLYVIPVLALLTGSVAGMIGYLAGVAGRVVTARATGGRALPDALAHPVSVVLFGWLVVRSFALRGRVTWKGRVLR